MRDITYNEAICEALGQAMSLDEGVFVMGQLVDYKPGVFGTTTGLAQRFGTERVQDVPISESAINQVALGAAVSGKRPVVVHQRLDFMLYSMDSIVNWMSLWHFNNDGKSNLPVTIRCIVGKGWGQGPQHSKSLHSWFAHLPGIRVAMPSTAFDAKGLLLESIFGETPTIIVEGRSLFSMKTPVPNDPYRVRFGQAVVRKPGKDVTIVAVGWMMPLALKAASLLSDDGIDAEVIDLRTISPWDRTTVLESVARTGRLVVADPSWKQGGFAGEVIATVSGELTSRLKANPVRVTLPDSHTPVSWALESEYYPSEVHIRAAARTQFD